MKTCWIFSIIAGCTLTACEMKQDRFGRTAEPGSQPEPLTLKEVSFHVRMASPEADIVAQAARRGLVLADEPRKELASVNASPSLIEKLTAPAILLTKAERQLYEQRLAVRTSTRSVDEASTQEFLDRRNAEATQSLAATKRAQIQRQIAELSAKAQKIRAEQRRESYSRSSNSPYQRRQAEIDEINREIATLNRQAQ